MVSRGRTLLAMMLVACTLAPELAEGAGAKFEDSDFPRQVVLGTGTVVASVVYWPVKFLYAAGATFTAGLVLAYTGGDPGKETAARIVRRGTRGDWWVHPDAFTGHRVLHFNGPE